MCCCGYLNCIALSFSAFLTAHPLPYVRPAIEDLDTVFFTGVQKSNDLGIHERYSVEVQCNPRPGAFQLRLQFLQMLRLQPTAKANLRLETSGFFFKLYCH